MNRRTFLRVIGSAAVGLAVTTLVPAVIEGTAIPNPFWAGNVDSGPLTYEMLERAYQACVTGSGAPNCVIVSSSFARSMGLVYDVDLDDVEAA